MKLNTRFLGTLTMMGFMVFIAGCRPTIEFKSNSTTAAPGETVTLEWEVEFAKGTSSSKVTVTDLGEVEPEGTGDVVVNETKDFQIRVSTFVLGMPITAKQSVTINVPEDNFKAYDFEDQGTSGWELGNAFYDSGDSPKDETGVVDVTGVICWDSSINPNVSNPGGGLGDSLKFCTDNDAAGQQEENERYNMVFVQRTIRDDDDFDIERNTRYKVGYEITFGIKFDEATCKDIQEKLSESKDDRKAILGNLHLVLGVARDQIETRTEDDIVKLKLEEFINDSSAESNQDLLPGVSSSDGYPVDGPMFLTAADTLEAITINSSILKDADPEEDIEEGGCDDSSGLIDPQVIKGHYKGITDTGYVFQTANDDRELQLFVGFLNTTDEPDIEFYIDTIRVQLLEE